MPVQLKQAVANAIDFASGVLGNRAGDVQLEEVESVDNNGSSVWRITLSMIRPDDPRADKFDSALNAAALMAGSTLNAFRLRHRDYKIFTVLNDTGEVTAMKIREFAGE